MWLEDVWAVFVVSLGHIKEGTGTVRVVCDDHSLGGWALGHGEVQVATNVGRETLLTGLEDDDPHFAF